MAERLPIEDVLPDCLASLAHRPNLVLAAPPGAGKTTGLPLALLEAPWATGRILMLEPRRIAARAAAARMAETLGSKLGQLVGYRVRGDAAISDATRIEVVTEGILTAMLRRDAELPGYSAVLFDEIHERSVHADLGLALCLEVQETIRPDLRLIAMSATLDTEAFARMIPDAHVVQSAGRSFAVSERWLERSWKAPGPRRPLLARAVVDAIEDVWADSEGDVLVFLPGRGEIGAVEGLLAARMPGVLAQPLFGAMSLEAQRAVLRPSDSRRIVLATAIAETSLTVPGVRVVIDSGLARRSRVDRSTGLSRLVTEPVSRAEAIQRAGRAGRLGPGICVKLWPRGEESALPAQAPPEILTTDLTALALDLAVWGTQDVSELRFLDLPPAGALAAARALLHDLGAIDGDGKLTAHGATLAEMPVHPRLGHMLTRARATGQEPVAALIAAVVSERPIPDIDGADLRLRLEAVMQPGKHRDQNRGHLLRIHEDARRLCKARPRGQDITDHAGILAALAYPDRIAQRRRGEAPRYLLANGRGALMDARDPLGQSPYLVTTDLEDGREARIRVALPITLAEIREAFAIRITTTQTVEWDSRHRRIIAEQREMFGALVLESQPWRDPPQTLITSALLDGLRELGLATILDGRDVQSLRDRVRRCAQASTDADALPDMSEQALTDTLEDWLAPHLGTCRQIGDIARLNLGQILGNLLDWDQQQLLDRLVPRHFTSPLGTRVPIDYANDTPAIEIRLQELFGLTHHPHVGAPARPLLLHLLSPARRVVQSTMDLPGFWAGSYRDVRKDMRAQYPKHPWPDDPAAADPTRRAKPRKR